MGLPCCAWSCRAVSPCVGVCCVGLFGVAFSPVVGCPVVLPAIPPAGWCAQVFRFLLVGCVLIGSPPWLVCGALCSALLCVVSCGAAVCCVFCVLPGAVWRACVRLGSCAVLSGAVSCWVVLCCFFCVMLSCAAAFSAGFFSSVVPCLSVVHRAVYVSVVLFRGVYCCSAWPRRVALLCWFLLCCAVLCSVVPWCVS